jgi:hypothetical protein
VCYTCTCPLVRPTMAKRKKEQSGEWHYHVQVLHCSIITVDVCLLCFRLCRQQLFLYFRLFFGRLSIHLSQQLFLYFQLYFGRLSIHLSQQLFYISRYFSGDCRSIFHLPLFVCSTNVERAIVSLGVEDVGALRHFGPSVSR